MRLLGFDLETTGLDVKKDRIYKMGAVLMEVGNPVMLWEKEWSLWHDDYPECSVEALKTHGITKSMAQEFGEHPQGPIVELAKFLEDHKVDYLVAHNGHAFDFPMLCSSTEAYASHLKNTFVNFKKIDTTVDVPIRGIKTRKLSYLAAEHGFVNPFPHSTISDVRTMLKVLNCYSLEEVMRRAASKTVIIIACVSYEDRNLAKEAGFYWNPAKSVWLKSVKECDLESEKYGFKTTIVGATE